MHALLYIQNMRKKLENIEFVGMLRTAKANKRDYQKSVDRWAREGEIDLRWEE